jgi:peptide/nickel transport system permease protein
MRVLLRSPLSAFGTIVVIAFFASAVVISVAGPLILPYEPNHIDLSNTLAFPSYAHPMGTDNFGRDLFSRVLVSIPIDAAMSVFVVAVSIALALSCGTLAGYLGGKTDDLVMRPTDVFMAFPGIILALAIASALGPSLDHVAEALVVVWWPPYVRIARAETLAMRENLYVLAAQAAGQRTRTTIRRHIIPNILPPLVVYATLDIGGVILVASILSYLGLGAQPPMAEWGRMVFDSQDYLFSEWWLPIFPAIAILVTVLGFNLLGDELRDILDPKRLLHLR